MGARAFRARYFAASVLLVGLLVLTGFSGCCACPTSCSGCPAGEYCEVLFDTDADGPDSSAECLHIPKACAAAPACDCLAKAEQAFGGPDARVHCHGDEKSGFTVDVCLPGGC
jgi:hypothetical protein